MSSYMHYVLVKKAYKESRRKREHAADAQPAWTEAQGRDKAVYLLYRGSCQDCAVDMCVRVVDLCDGSCCALHKRCLPCVQYLHRLVHICCIAHATGVVWRCYLVYAIHRLLMPIQHLQGGGYWYRASLAVCLTAVVQRSCNQHIHHGPLQSGHLHQVPSQRFR